MMRSRKNRDSSASPRDDKPGVRSLDLTEKEWEDIVRKRIIPVLLKLSRQGEYVIHVAGIESLRD